MGNNTSQPSDECQGNSVCFDSTSAITMFLDTMDNRREDGIQYSAYILVLTRISSAALGRFGTELSTLVTKLTLDFFENWTKSFCLLTDFGNRADWYKEKEKAIQILGLLPNIQELHMLYQDSQENVLNPDLLLLLPHTFPQLTIFKITDLATVDIGPVLRSGCECGSPDWTDYTSPNTFLAVILQRAPNLKHLQIKRHDSFMPYSFTLLPGFLAGLPSPPALTLDMKCGIGYTATIFRRHESFLRDLTITGYNQLRSLDLVIYDPTPQLMLHFYEFLNLQAPCLESLQLLYFGSFFSARDLITIPSMPNLTFLEMIFYNWIVSPVMIDPLLYADTHFPKIGPVKFEKNWGMRSLFYTAIRITGQSPNSS